MNIKCICQLKNNEEKDKPNWKHLYMTAIVELVEYLETAENGLVKPAWECKRAKEDLIIREKNGGAAVE